MPIVTATPRSNSNGEVVTEFLDTVNTIPTTYTFLNTQERLKVKNNGYGSFQLTVNGSVVTMLPSESKEFYGSIDSFVIASNGGVQSFEVVGTNYKDEEFQLTGSYAKLFLPISASATDQVFILPFSSREIMFVNDGADVMNVSFDGRNTTGGQTYENTDPLWTFTGTWATTSMLGKNPKYSKSINNNAVIKPGLKGLFSLTWGLVTGQGCGIAKIELSTDGGITWKNPSAIPGVTRSDGATGTGMDTHDGYVNVSGQLSSLTFNLPFNGSYPWSLRITPTGTANASATDSNIFIVDSRIKDGSVLLVNPKESIALEIATSQFSVSSPSTTNGRVNVI